MGDWLVKLQNFRFRRCLWWLILMGLAGFVGLMKAGISSQQPKMPTKKGEEKSHPRIAICLVGGARRFELTGPSLLKHVLNRYNNTDVFLNAPFDNDSHKFFFLKNANSLAAVRIFSPDTIEETTKRAEVLTPKGSPNGLQGLLQYFYLVEGCLKLIKSYQAKYKVKYDWIVRTRVDGYWNGPLPPPQSYLNKRYIVPSGSQYGGLNDRLGIGNMETTEVALSRLSLVPLLYSNGDRNLNSEKAFKHQLDVKGVKYKSKTFPFCIVSERKYNQWRPSKWHDGQHPSKWCVPVASLSTRGHLNGVKCRPCMPASKGTEAMDIIRSLNRSWGWTLAPPGLELCDAHDDWEEKWEDIFDNVAGPNLAAARKKIKNQTLSSCIEDFKAMKQKTACWVAPPSETICKKVYAKSQ